MALLLVESFAILDALINCEFPLTNCSLPDTHGVLRYVVHTILLLSHKAHAPNNPNSTLGFVLAKKVG